MTVEDVARAFRVPLPLVGSMQGATYNNVEQLIALWMCTGSGFVLEHIESRARYVVRHCRRGEAIEFDTDSLQRTDFKGRVEALTKGISGGLYSPERSARARGTAPRRLRRRAAAAGAGGAALARGRRARADPRAATPAPAATEPSPRRPAPSRRRRARLRASGGRRMDSATILDAVGESCANASRKSSARSPPRA